MLPLLAQGLLPRCLLFSGAAAAAAASRLASSALYNTSAGEDLKNALAELIPYEQARLLAIKKKHGSQKLGDVTVDMAIGGMRGIPAMLWETSLLDADEGIRFRGYSIPDLEAKLPKAKPGGQPLPEGLLWLLLTGKIPTPGQVSSVTEELRRRSAVPPHLKKVLDALPPGTHPMTQLTSLVMALQPSSKFAKAYEEGIHKSRYWDPFYEDSMDLIAKLPECAAMVYRNTYHNKDYISPDPNLDWAANLSFMMGYPNEEVMELMRMYQTIHSDHEGGNVSAHTTHLVASALSDPYLSFAAGLNGLAGPLHGLANQEVMRWLKALVSKLGPTPSKAELTKYVEDTLDGGKVVPGYGHGVLRKTDPRYTCQREFALKFLPDDPMFGVVSNLYEVVPSVLGKMGKIKNPWPNVDAHSGVLLQYYGLKEEGFYTVLFGVSRALGVLSQGVWDRALGLPIERPKSITSDWIEKKFGTTQ